MLKSIKRRLKNILVSTDQHLLCIFTLGGTSPDETLSAAAWRWEKNGKFSFIRKTIDYTFLKLFNDIDHCKESYESEVFRKHLDPEYNKVVTDLNIS